MTLSTIPELFIGFKYLKGCSNQMLLGQMLSLQPNPTTNLWVWFWFTFSHISSWPASSLSIVGDRNFGFWLGSGPWPESQPRLRPTNQFKIVPEDQYNFLKKVRQTNFSANSPPDSDSPAKDRSSSSSCNEPGVGASLPLCTRNGPVDLHWRST